MNRPPRARIAIAHSPNGQPRTFRLAPASRDAAYRRLATAILGLDVPTLASELRAARRAVAGSTRHLALAA